MTPARQVAKELSAPAPPPLPTGHVHLPSVHVLRNGSGFDYEEDLYVRRRKRHTIVERVVRLDLVVDGALMRASRTVDQLCAQEIADFSQSLELLTETDILGGPMPDAVEHMQQRAQLEYERQLRILAGAEKACTRCGCSASRACSGGCIWATKTLCSRCVL